MEEIMNIIFKFIVCFSLMGIFMLTACSSKKEANLVLTKGKIWTVNPKQPWAEAIAVYGEKIIAVGSNKEIEQYISEKTAVIDLNGKLVLPGLIDSHTHFMQGGQLLLQIDLRSAKSEEDFASKIKEYAESLPPGDWILGGNWDEESWPSRKLPAKEIIDPYTSENPVLIGRYDGHLSLANSLALKLAGITKQTPDPPGGKIIKNPETGEPTGILKDAAENLVSKIIPPASKEQLLAAAHAAMNEAKRFGLTGVMDNTSSADFAIYQNLLKNGELTVRIYSLFPLPRWKELANLGIKTGFGNDMLKIGCMKGFMDGSVGSRTAMFFDEYNDDPGNYGLPNQMMFPEGNMKEMVSGADKAGLHIAIHAIGDKANNLLLNIYKETIEENGERDRRFRTEHAQHLLPEDIKRFAQLHVIASVQPYHAIDDGRWVEDRIGHKRCQTTYAFKSLLDAGTTLALGSDWPVAPLNPLTGIYAAVTRRTIDGKNPDGWFPEQKISLEEAIKGYTLNGAFAMFEENSRGSLETGKLADMVVLSEDLFSIPPEKIVDAMVMYTILGGKIIYQAK
jgi:predicted amidohydrolase YtcJ